MIDLFLKGGPLMYPLLLGSVISLALILERGLCLLRSRTNRRKIEEIKELVQGNAYERAASEVEGLAGPVASLCAMVLRSRDMSLPELEKEISLAGSRKLKALNRNLHILELIGKISPMVGLFGTVLGLARTFQTVAQLKRMANPALLASGIWEALITTVAGLFIGIPAIIFYHLYDNRARSIAFEMRTYAEEFISHVKENE
ncbi:MAG TPA: MotA/TolQ/ExbB proton channel family protein [Spirochaetia bacterium]|nr:MotA/TolQ/ExbB proton channel family protein [Spirochaetia bacterium]